ncbi:hypothetical protein B4102_3584 [Heyndrickxia sporothermodurans]|uniref:Uncharacterized protein n=2 Tax=Heyndrickxia sporothermodurans TaxID=46224 RepID=A0A150KLJ3_9BACI|nr:hypothetical protein B4102_3584 [Heyndrickxia sporothermodurans]
MVDLPFILEEKAKEKSARLLEQIMILIATNGRLMEDDEYKKFINNVTQPISEKEKEKEPNNQFDRDKFEQLRFLTNMGANRM